jgi:hypothetical protein
MLLASFLQRQVDGRSSGGQDAVRFALARRLSPCTWLPASAYFAAFRPDEGLE